MSVEILERTTGYLAVNFLDKSGVLSAPTAISYRIDCLTTGANIRPLTAVTPASASVEVTLTPTDNALQDQTNDREVRRVTIIAQYGDENDQAVGTFDYAVRNVTGVLA